MKQLSSTAYDTLKRYAQSPSGFGFGGLQGLLRQLKAAQIILTDDEFQQIAKKFISSYYINDTLSWKLSSIVQEVESIKLEYKSVILRWLKLTRFVDIFNKNVSNAETLEIAKTEYDDFIKLKQTNSGKLKAERKELGKILEALNNKYYNKFKYSSLIAENLKDFICNNQISDFITSNVKRYIDILSNDNNKPEVAYDIQIKNAKGIIVEYDTDTEKIFLHKPKNEDISESDEQIVKNLLFNDLPIIEQWAMNIYHL